MRALNFRFGMPWSRDLDAALLAGARDGLSASQTAKRLYQQFHINVSRCACIGRARRLGFRFQGRKQAQPKKGTP